MKQVFQVNIFYIPSGYLTWPWYRWPIEIDGLPIRNGGSFHGYVSHNQRVCIYIYIYYIYNHFANNQDVRDAERNFEQLRHQFP